MGDVSSRSPLVVAFSGLPGTGKTTMAERLAATIGAPAFAGDWLMGALRPYGVLNSLDRAAYLEMYYGLLRTLITRQLLLRQSAITDCLLSDEVVRNWRSLADEHGARFRVVECVCSDVSLHRARLRGRTRGIPGWHEVGWDHVRRMRDEYPPLTVRRLVLDAVHPVEDNLALVRAYVAGNADTDAADR